MWVYGTGTILLFKRATQDNSSRLDDQDRAEGLRTVFLTIDVMTDVL